MSNTEQKFKWWLGFGAGVFTALTVISALLALGTDYSEHSTSAFLYKWQTLIAGVLALIGAAFTIVAVERQLSRQREEECKRRTRVHFAARAGMPASLTQLVHYSTVSLTVLKEIYRAPDADGRVLHPAPWNQPQLPEIPRDALSTLQTCIETADAPAMDAIAKLIEDFQVIDARLRALAREIAPGSDVRVSLDQMNERIVETVEFEMRCQNMFDYARRRSTVASAEILNDELTRRTRFLGFREHDYPGVETMAARWRPELAGR